MRGGGLVKVVGGSVNFGDFVCEFSECYEFCDFCEFCEFNEICESCYLILRLFGNCVNSWIF